MRMKPPAGPELNSIQNIADRMDVSPKTVRRWIASGDLIVHRIGAVVRVSEADLQAFLARHRDV